MFEVKEIPFFKIQSTRDIMNTRLEYLNNIMSSDAFESAHAEVTSTFYLHVRSPNCYYPAHLTFNIIQ